MILEDYTPEPADLAYQEIPPEECRRLWPGTRYELLAYARYLERSGHRQDAQRIRIAVQLATELAGDGVTRPEAARGLDR
jgi:hypothetical protein